LFFSFARFDSLHKSDGDERTKSRQRKMTKILTGKELDTQTKGEDLEDSRRKMMMMKMMTESGSKMHEDDKSH
jgi:hypothetical protein